MTDDSKSTTLLGRMGDWWRQPFQSGGSAFNWVMFVGLIIIAAFLWQLVLLEFAKEI